MASALRNRLLAVTGRRITTTTTTSFSTPILPRPAASARPYSSSSSPWETGPSPPRLPAEEQAEFERLQRTANTQEGFNPSATPADFVIPSTPTATKSASASASASSSAAAANASHIVPGEDGGGPAPTPLRKGAPPEFEGEVNPKTGEVGGPKNEPLRWGAGGDYSYNGRVTDF